jgi:hypothetical protein
MGQLDSNVQSPTVAKNKKPCSLAPYADRPLRTMVCTSLRDLLTEV